MSQPAMKRLATYLADDVYDRLEEWAAKEKRSLSNLVSFILEVNIRARYGDLPVDDELTSRGNRHE